MVRRFRIPSAVGGLVFVAALAVPAGRTQAAQPPVGAAASQASQPENDETRCRKLLAAMVTALGGDKWLALQSIYFEGRTSSFYQGKPTGGVSDFFSTRTPPTAAGPGQERIEFTKKHDFATIFNPDAAWEITFRGKAPLPPEQAQEYFRRRNHSVEVAIRLWLKDPAMVLLWEGQSTAERHLADQVTLISSSNDAITLQLDTGTHLPLRRTFRWRDPLYKDKNEEAEEYDDYHVIDGIATPFTVTRFHNGDMVNQLFLYRAAYNGAVAPGAFDADQAAAKLKH